MRLLTPIITFCSGHDFIVSFFSSLAAAVATSILLVLWGYFYTPWIVPPKPKLTMVVKQDGVYDSVIHFTRQEDGSYEAKFQLAINNTGNLSLKPGDGYWHVYVNTDVATQFDAPGERNHKRGLISYPIYAHYIVDLDAVYRLVIHNGETPADGIRYFFATDYGFFPDSTEFNQKDGQVRVSSIGIIKFVIPSPK